MRVRRRGNDPDDPIAQYIRGYLEQPETEEEIAFAEACLADIAAELANDPW